MIKKICLITIALMIILTGCNNKKQEDENIENITSTEENYTKEENTYENRLILSMGNVNNLNPLLNSDKSADDVLKLIYEPLVIIDENFKVSPNIAESWSFSDDGLSLTVKIKSGLKWHNGDSITSDDIIFSLNTIRNSAENSYYKSCVQNVVSYSAIDSLTFKINFNGVYSGNIYSLCFPPISSRYYKGQDVLNSKLNLVPMGNGSYEFESFIPAKELNLKKCESSLKNIPNIEKITAKIVSGKDTQIYSFQQGIVDAVNLSSTELGNIDNLNNIKQHDFSTNYFDFVGINFKNNILNNKEVRKAIAHAIPKDNIVESIYLKHATVADTMINPNSWLYEEDVVKYEYSLDKSREILEHDGWIINSDTKKRYKLTGETIQELDFSILVNKENEERKQVARRLAQELNSIGFKIEVDEVEFSVYSERLKKGEFDMFVGGWNISLDPDLRFMLHSNYIGGSNFVSYSNESMDSLLYTASIALNDESLKTAYSNLQKYIAQEIPYIGIAYRNSALYVNGKIDGDVEPIFYNSLNGIEKWRISGH